MIRKGSTLERNRLEDTVRALCLLIQDNIKLNIQWDEFSLRRELVACILSSQVRYEMAKMALKCIEESGLLSDNWWGRIDNKFEVQLYKLLSGQNLTQHGHFRYRFPNVKAYQLAKARNAVVKEPLSEWICNISDPKYLRKKLVIEISGLGPKQASMFLRNVGISHDLAILDKHVIRYMDSQNLLCNNNIVSPSTLPAYEQIEQIFLDYADVMGFSVGCLDLAIWATMRAARELNL